MDYSIVEEAQEAYDNMALEISYLSTEAPIRNGYYILDLNGSVVDTYKREGYEYDEPRHVVSGKYMAEIRSLVNRHCYRAKDKREALESEYAGTGGDPFYVSAPSSLRKIQHYYCIVEEGKLYTYSYRYDQ